VRAPTKTLLFTVRISSQLGRALAREARRRRTTKSDVAREILDARLVGGRKPGLAEEARRQSLLVSGRRSEREALQLLESLPEIDAWS
jgi:hypothetical protein